MPALHFRPFSSCKCTTSVARQQARQPAGVNCHAVTANHADLASSSKCSSDSSNSWPALRRRDMAMLLPLAVLLSSASPCMAEEAASSSTTSTSTSSSSSSSTSSAPSPELELFYDNDYELLVPGNYTYLETPTVVVERGPQPERSPVLARFEPRGGSVQPGSITILTRRATVFKQTVFQVSDISQLGDPIAVANLVLPRGSTLLAASTQVVEQPAKETPLGPVDIPPQTYYAYEFTTTTGMHIAMAVSAKRGSVYLCGASTTAEAWPQAGGVFNKVVRSFRMRSKPSIS